MNDESTNNIFSEPILNSIATYREIAAENVIYKHFNDMQAIRSNRKWQNFKLN